MMRISAGLMMMSCLLLASCSGDTKQSSKATDTTDQGYLRTDPNRLNEENTGTGTSPGSDTSQGNTIFQSHSNTPSPNAK